MATVTGLEQSALERGLDGFFGASSLLGIGASGRVFFQPGSSLAAHSRAIYSTAADAPSSVLDGSIRNVNPNRGLPKCTKNCQNCVIATDRTLGGTPASAMPSLIPLPRKNLEVLYGGEFANVSGMMEFGAALRQSGNGARGIVGGSHPRGYGHVWNVVNQDGVIRFLDSQGHL